MATKKKDDEQRILRRIKMQLPRKLEGTELIGKGKDLASVLEEIGNQLATEAMVKQQLKSAMSALEARRDELRMVVSRGEVVEEVEVEDRCDDKKLLVLRVRTDNGAVISERKQTSDERQVPLALDGAAASSELPS